MLSLQSQQCVIRGAFHLCFKRKKKQQTKSEGVKCLLQCWFCLYTILISAAPYQAQHSYCSQSAGGQSFNQERGDAARECVCVSGGGMTRTNTHAPTRRKTNQKKKKRKRKSKVVGVVSVSVCVRVCIPLKSPKPKCTFASPEKPLPSLSANVQDEMQTNLHLFFFPFIFKQMLQIFIIQDLQKDKIKKKNNFLLQPN